LKTMEGTIRTAFTEIRDAMTATPAARMGALLQRRRLQDLRDRLDPDTYGGGVLLGLNGTVVIAHGASRARAITSACELAHRLAAGRIVERIREQVAQTRTSRFGRWTHGDRDGSDRQAERGRQNERAPDRQSGSGGHDGAQLPAEARAARKGPAGDSVPDRVQGEDCPACGEGLASASPCTAARSRATCSRTAGTISRANSASRSGSPPNRNVSTPWPTASSVSS